MLRKIFYHFLCFIEKHPFFYFLFCLLLMFIAIVYELFNNITRCLKSVYHLIPDFCRNISIRWNYLVERDCIATIRQIIIDIERNMNGQLSVPWTKIQAFENVNSCKMTLDELRQMLKDKGY